MKPVYEFVEHKAADNYDAFTVGVYSVDGGFLAMTYTSSRTFKTISGAFRWLESRGFKR